MVATRVAQFIYTTFKPTQTRFPLKKFKKRERTSETEYCVRSNNEGNATHVQVMILVGRNLARLLSVPSVTSSTYAHLNSKGHHADTGSSFLEPLFAAGKAIILLQSALHLIRWVLVDILKFLTFSLGIRGHSRIGKALSHFGFGYTKANKALRTGFKGIRDRVHDGVEDLESADGES
ncbi:hypothetical protein B0J17DRAFT_633973 [Rhizoctonia solani]|nr:hypothetical protein B0J17DRAFT_633973 [Rhizoctonia solani]